MFENQMVIDREEKERKYVTCDKCGEHIHFETPGYYQDECYEVDGYNYCEDCIADVVKEKFMKVLR